MFARVYSCAVIGLEGVIVEVEVDSTNGLPGTDIVGLPDKAVQESCSRVQSARDCQTARFTCFDSQKTKHESSHLVSNADMRVAEIRQFCKLDEAGESLIRAAMGQMNLSACGNHRVLKLARTIADLSEGDQIQAVHLAEALQYRPKLMMG